MEDGMLEYFQAEEEAAFDRLQKAKCEVEAAKEKVKRCEVDWRDAMANTTKASVARDLAS